MAPARLQHSGITLYLTHPFAPLTRSHTVAQTHYEGGAPSFDELLRDARQGSNAALGSLLESFHEFLDQRSHRLLGRDLRGLVSDADLVQDCDLQACRDFGSFLGSARAELAAWLAGILRH